jgi:hypothetical protein
LVGHKLCFSASLMQHKMFSSSHKSQYSNLVHTLVMLPLTSSEFKVLQAITQAYERHEPPPRPGYQPWAVAQSFPQLRCVLFWQFGSRRGDGCCGGGGGLS